MGRMGRGQQPERTWLSQSAAARLLPISASTLREYGRLDAFYGPDIDGLAGVPGGARVRGAAVQRYHRDHVALIEQVLTGQVDRETAALAWAVRRRRGLAKVG